MCGKDEVECDKEAEEVEWWQTRPEWGGCGTCSGACSGVRKFSTYD